MLIIVNFVSVLLFLIITSFKEFIKKARLNDFGTSNVWQVWSEQNFDVKGCDSNFEVNTFQVLKSCYKWNNYVALKPWTKIALENYNINDQQFNRHDIWNIYLKIRITINCIGEEYKCLLGYIDVLLLLHTNILSPSGFYASHLYI